MRAATALPGLGAALLLAGCGQFDAVRTANRQPATITMATRDELARARTETGQSLAPLAEQVVNLEERPPVRLPTGDRCFDPR
ncbi:MAG TPA: hypothetical protein VNQ90_10505 [Chthoniobacteraceae bacterium]|nr:hypothetical protein [Chthoniobacteraceae bacterium]